VLTGSRTKGATLEVDASDLADASLSAEQVDGKLVISTGSGSDKRTVTSYTIDDSRVIDVIKEVKIAQPETSTESEVDGEHADKASEAMSKSNNNVDPDDVKKSAYNTLKTEGNKLLENSDTYKEATVKVNVEVKATDLTNDTYSLEITPNYEVFAKTNIDDEDVSNQNISLGSGTLSGTKAFDTPVTVTVDVPTNLSVYGLYAKHYLNAAKTKSEIISVTVGGSEGNYTATWEQSSFSPTDLISGKYGTITFVAADGEETQVDYVEGNLNDSLPTDKTIASTNKFAGWKINGEGTTYTKLNSDLLNALNDSANHKLTLVSYETKKTTPSTDSDTTDTDDTTTSTPSTSGGGTSGSSESSSSSNVVIKSSSSSSKNGTVTVSTKDAKKGETVTLTVTPKTGYELDTLTVKDASGKTITVTAEKDGTYTFTMPSGSVTVEATYKAAGTTTTPTTEGGFTDLDKVSDEFKEAIQWAYDNGYMNGYSTTTFGPTGSVSRQQLWMILARLSGANPSNMAEAKAWAVSNGISDGSNPGNAVSRQQMVTILYRYAALKGYNTTGGADLTTYPDSGKVSGYAQDAMSWSVSNGIVGGTTQGTLNPAGTATRGAFATILKRFCDNMIG
jgi:hypothetical protein